MLETNFELIAIEDVKDFIKRSKDDYFSKKENEEKYLYAYLSGCLQEHYRYLAQRVQRQHNDELPRMKQGEDAIKLLYEICENTQRTGSGDFIIDKKYIRKIEELLRSE